MTSPLVRLSAAALACLALYGPCHAQSVWKWRDANGQFQVSDRPPPMNVPEASILQRPANTRLMPRPAELSAPASGAASGTAGASAPLSAKDAELEARKRKLQQEQEARKKTEQEQAASAREKAQAQRAEACTRMRNQLLAIDSGQRIARINSKGERENLDDAGRAEEAKRLRDSITENCQ